MQIVGDDLTVTNPIRIEKAAKMGACNALLLKVNQIGSVTESINAVKLAKQSGNILPDNQFLHLLTPIIAPFDTLLVRTPLQYTYLSIHAPC